MRLVGVVGDDWPAEHTELLKTAASTSPACTSVPDGKTFRWTGRYDDNMNDRETLDVQLNVFGEFDPVLPESYRRAKFVFLANGVAGGADESSGASPRAASGRRRHDGPLDQHRARRPDGAAHAHRRPGHQRQRSQAAHRHGKPRPAGHRVREMGPKFVVIKKGEHGAMFFSEHETYVLPAFPTDEVVDPTGAGDSFAGGMMGYLAEQDNFDPETLKDSHGLRHPRRQLQRRRLRPRTDHQITRDDIDERMEEYRKMLSF